MVQNSTDSTAPSEVALSAVRIVLVAPAGPLNIGSVARVMKNFGLSQLVLVSPQCDPLGAEALQMAVHAKDLLHAAKIVETIPEALNGCDRAIATTARVRGFNAPLQRPEIALPTLLTHPAAEHSQSPTALLFGPEDRGLSNEELIYAQQFTKIPTHPGYSALNLAQAVAVCCYELYRASISTSPSQPFTRPLTSPPAAEPISPSVKKDTSNPLLTTPLSGKQTESNPQTPPPERQTSERQTSELSEQRSEHSAKLNELEGYYQHLEAVLLKVEYLYPHTAASRMRKFRQLLHRAAPTTNEVALLRGILRQVEWALSESNKDER